jgi:hypothetical protein
MMDADTYILAALQVALSAEDDEHREAALLALQGAIEGEGEGEGEEPEGVAE